VDLDELRVFADQAVGPVRAQPGVAHAAVEDLLEEVSRRLPREKSMYGRG
jgi:hypothetical protein